MKRILILMIINIYFILNAYSQETKSTLTLDQILFETSKNPVVIADFKQSKKIEVLTKPIESNGKFIIAIKKGIVFQTIFPLPSIMAISENRVILTDHENSKKIIDAKSQPVLQQASDTFLCIFQNNAKEVLNKHSVNIKGDISNWELKLTPIKKNDFINSITCKGEKGQLNYIILDEANGDSTTIHFSNHQIKDSLNKVELSLYE